MNRFRKPNGMMSTVTRGAKQCDGWDGEHLTHNNSDWNDCPAQHSKLSDIKEKLQLFAINKAEMENNKKWISENKQGFELKHLTH